eukprot:Nk52_evm1s361 gene=Nk52_evmTU1s361
MKMDDEEDIDILDDDDDSSTAQKVADLMKPTNGSLLLKGRTYSPSVDSPNGGGGSGVGPLGGSDLYSGVGTVGGGNGFGMEEEDALANARLLAEYQEPDWNSVSGKGGAVSGIDDKSRALIEQMLQEEEYFFQGRISAASAKKKQQQLLKKTAAHTNRNTTEGKRAKEASALRVQGGTKTKTGTGGTTGFKSAAGSAVASSGVSPTVRRVGRPKGSTSKKSVSGRGNSGVFVTGSEGTGHNVNGNDNNGVGYSRRRQKKKKEEEREREEKEREEKERKRRKKIEEEEVDDVEIDITDEEEDEEDVVQRVEGVDREAPIALGNEELSLLKTGEGNVDSAKGNRTEENGSAGMKDGREENKIRGGSSSPTKKKGEVVTSVASGEGGGVNSSLRFNKLSKYRADEVYEMLLRNAEIQEDENADEDGDGVDETKTRSEDDMQNKGEEKTLSTTDDSRSKASNMKHGEAGSTNGIKGEELSEENVLSKHCGEKGDINGKNDEGGVVIKEEGVAKCSEGTVDDGSEYKRRISFSDEMNDAEQESFLNLNDILPEEMDANSEFFMGHRSKTPQRYMKIRNHIIKTWLRKKPTYVSKTSVRPALKDCGDVNAIGRVHQYLESAGVINYGAVAPTFVRPKRRRVNSDSKPYEGRDISDRELSSIDHFATSADGPRRRRVRDEETGEWIDEKELEGRVIEHEKIEEMKKIKLQEQERKRLLLINQKYFADDFSEEYADLSKAKGYYRGKGSKRGDDFRYLPNDPFRLVECSEFGSSPTPVPDSTAGASSSSSSTKPIQANGGTIGQTSPFKVIVTSNALLLMDAHSHMAHTEIIGLLGGTFDEVERVLKVSMTFPCNSLSTGVQCEMDPASEMEARGVFEAKRLQVVGWYHSHPTFAPNPSLRDIENQFNYQQLFYRDEWCTSPFIGVIVTPYDVRYPSNVSLFSYLYVSETEWDANHEYRVPYKLAREIARSESVGPEVLNEIAKLIHTYKSHPDRVNLLSSYRRGELLSCLDKLLISLSSRLYTSEIEQQAFLDKVRSMVLSSITASSAAGLSKQEPGAAEASSSTAPDIANASMRKAISVEKSKETDHGESEGIAPRIESLSCGESEISTSHASLKGKEPLKHRQ